MIVEINEKFSLNMFKTKVSNHLKTFKEQMVLEKTLDLKSRIEWNDTTKTFEASKKVWKPLLMVWIL